MKPDTSHELDLEVVFEGLGVGAEMEAMSIQSILEAGGIPAVLVGSASLPNFPFQIKVPHDQVTEAKRRIEEAKAAGPSGAEEAEETPLQRTPGLLELVAPILPSLNLDESIAFAVQLGFSLTKRHGDRYATVARDGVSLHFFPCAEDEAAENSGCYIYSKDVNALHAEFASNGLESQSDVESNSDGMLEFHVTDPSGNCIRFSQRAS